MTLQAMTRRFAPVDLAADLSSLPTHEQHALAELVEAARIVDAIHLRQVWAGNETMFQTLARDASDEGRARLRYFLINKGPWSRLDGDTPFIAGVPERPPQANFYPSSATKEEVGAWIEGLSPHERSEATGFFTAIRRANGGGFAAVPYALEYQGELEAMAARLRAAATLTKQSTLRRFLVMRADALLSNDYYASDVAWMELDASIEPSIGPYEVYEDGWFNYKAAFGAFITVRDDAETRSLARFGGLLQQIENDLPIDPTFRNPKIGAMTPIRVVNTVFSAGDANKGVQTAAFNLPNDERVIAAKGSKSVMLKNNQEAKFRSVLQPISTVALVPGDRSRVTFEAFFTHILLHELMHGLGPHAIDLPGGPTTVRQALKDTHSTIEEVKADIGGLLAFRWLVDRKELDRSLLDTMYVTYLASMFRSIRFGISEAHGCGVAIQLNYFLDHGGVRVAGDGTFGVDPARIGDNVTSLAREIMTVQAHGDYGEAARVIATRGVVRPPVQAVLDRLADIPVDIEPRFVTAESLTPLKG